VIGLFGGAFDPPHMGHVALVREAREQLRLTGVVVFVIAHPGHKGVDTPAETRLELARLAFPDEQVELDEHARTVDFLRARRFENPLFLIGADEFSDFLGWKEPEAVLELARVAVATRPGYPREKLQEVLEQLSRPERVLFFEIEPVPVSSRELRARVARGESIDGLVPPPVAAAVERLGLYRELH
jgi:nicotinate-nucleotide adenylyltransferase